MECGHGVQNMISNSKVVQRTGFIDNTISDRDQGSNGDVTMTVEWSNRDLITVTPVTFRNSAFVTMILTKPLDYERNKKHMFTVRINWPKHKIK